VDEQGFHLRGLVAGAGGALPLHPPSSHHGCLVAEAHLLAQRLFEVLQGQVTTRDEERKSRAIPMLTLLMLLIPKFI
jgi:hypothetical protein